MKGSYHGIMSVEEFFQALFQDRSFFEEHGITHIRSAGLYFTPCDQNGREVPVLDRDGKAVEGYDTAGSYRCAADGYLQAGELEPKTRVTRTRGRRSRGRKGGARRCRPT